ncbi:hypothetical protein SAMN02910292_02604 [Lachnospiraceae bacterium XBB2008]|nr:hypothetical protein SAMN02910292_02604 [Lachnospiraceae bacterium XBB2008]
MKKKLLTAMVIGMIMAAIVGCGKQEDTPSDAQTTDAAVTDTAATDATTTDTDATATEENVSMANPWVEISHEEAEGLCPCLFKAPEGATNEVWRKLEGSESDSVAGSPLVELDFTLDGMDFTARAQYGAAEDADISGMYYDWAVTDDVTFSNWRDGYMTGKMSRAISDDETADLITWYDIEIGIAYSLSVVAPDLDGFDISAVADAMYDPENAPGADIPDDDEMEEEHVMTTDIEGKDTFTQIVDALPDGAGYTNETVGDEDVLLVASGTFDAGEEYPEAIDSEIFWYDNGAPAYLGYVTSGGTAYPLMIGDGKLYTAGNHFVKKYVVTDGMLMVMEEAGETFDTDGNATYYYDSDDGGDYSSMSQEDAHAAYDKLFEEYTNAEIIPFNAIKK